MSETQGRRVESHEEFFAAEPGAYLRVNVTQGEHRGVGWLVKAPCGHHAMLALKPIGAGHDVDEHEDGTISLQQKPGNSNSLLCGGGLEDCGWHGYIDHGVFRSV